MWRGFGEYIQLKTLSADCSIRVFDSSIKKYQFIFII